MSHKLECLLIAVHLKEDAIYLDLVWTKLQQSMDQTLNLL